MTCECGQTDHRDQAEKLPFNAKIQTIVPVTSYSHGTIPVGATGRVTGHCDDGRAYISFDGYDKGHTFHEWEAFYVKLSQCRACEHELDDSPDGDEIDELGLCGLCHQLNQLAQDFGYDEIRRALPMLEELGSRESEQLGAILNFNPWPSIPPTLLDQHYHEDGTGVADLIGGRVDGSKE